MLFIVAQLVYLPDQKAVLGFYTLIKKGSRAINIFHPITKEIGDLIEQEVIKALKDVMKNDRYNITYNSTEGV